MSKILEKIILKKKFMEEIFHGGDLGSVTALVCLTDLTWRSRAVLGKPSSQTLKTSGGWSPK